MSPTPSASVAAASAALRDGRDVREGGAWTRSQRAKNALLFLLVTVLLAVADHLPARALLAWGRFLGGATWFLLRSLAAEAERRAALVMPQAEAARVSRRAFENAGENLALCLLLRRAGSRADEWVSVPESTREILHRARAGGRGIVFVSAHLGPFELLPVAVAEVGLPCSVVVRESYDQRLNALVDAHRHLHGVSVIHRGNAGAATRIVRALRENRIVGFLPDLESRVPSQSVRFMGRAARFPIGPQQIALRTGAPLVVGWLRRLSEPGARPKLEVCVEQVSLDEPAANDAGDLTANAGQRIAFVLERAILAVHADAREDDPADWLGWLRESPRKR